jgi:hypothetical protein
MDKRTAEEDGLSGFEMKSCIPHKLLVINAFAEQSMEDPCFMQCMKMAFQWANDMGINGKKVFDLHLERADHNNLVARPAILWCNIECTIEERERWEKMRELQIKQEVYEGLI